MSLSVFDGRSPLGQRYRSPLGVFGRHGIEQPFVLLFTRESIDTWTYYGVPDNVFGYYLYAGQFWLDQSRWDYLTATYGAPESGCLLCHVRYEGSPPGPIYFPIADLPTGPVAIPGEITYEQVKVYDILDRMSLTELQTLFLNAYVGSAPFPDQVIIVMCKSLYAEGAPREVLAYVLDPFEAWLTENGVAYAEAGYVDEFWLEQFGIYAYMSEKESESAYWDWYLANFP